MRAELDGVICSGPRRGKQFTYALLAERAPQAKTLTRDEALAELTRRYFTSHGPATARDFVWWSGLTVADAKAGLALVGADLSQEEIDGQTYWFSAAALPAAEPAHEAFLLPTYDELLVGYEGFGAALTGGRGNGEWAAFTATIVMGGRVVGNWRRTHREKDGGDRGGAIRPADRHPARGHHRRRRTLRRVRRHASGVCGAINPQSV